jgi:thioredoxin-dependent peroxiredoxin
MPAKKSSSTAKAPSFSAPITGDKKLKSSDLKGQKFVIYFYPKDNTSGCTKEGEAFRDLYAKFKKLGVAIYGVSRDSIKSHENFKEKYKFPFDLISDEDEVVCNAFGVMKMKSMYGRKYMGVERSTFFINEKGQILKEWRNVKVPGHVEEVLEFAKTLD